MPSGSAGRRAESPPPTSRRRSSGWCRRCRPTSASPGTPRRCRSRLVPPRRRRTGQSRSRAASCAHDGRRRIGRGIADRAPQGNAARTERASRFAAGYPPIRPPAGSTSCAVALAVVPIPSIGHLDFCCNSTPTTAAPCCQAVDPDQPAEFRYPARFRAVTSISIFMRGSARPADSMVAAGRISPKQRRSTGQQGSKSAAFGRM